MSCSRSVFQEAHYQNYKPVEMCPLNPHVHPKLLKKIHTPKLSFYNTLVFPLHSYTKQLSASKLYMIHLKPKQKKPSPEHLESDGILQTKLVCLDMPRVATLNLF